jgi:hypothetical protein
VFVVGIIVVEARRKGGLSQTVSQESQMSTDPWHGRAETSSTQQAGTSLPHVTDIKEKGQKHI